MTGPRIALIHALEESVEPARAAFREIWPEAFCFDLLDTSLSADRASSAASDAAIRKRIGALADYALESGGAGGRTRGVLFTCSAFGPMIDAVKARLPIPALKPNESAFAAALRAGRRIGLVVTFAPSEALLKTELEEMAAALGSAVSIRSVFAEGALAALKAGDGERHDHLAAEAAASLGDMDAIVLGQFSLARARSAAAQRTGSQVFTTPHAAVEALRVRVTGL